MHHVAGITKDKLFLDGLRHIEQKYLEFFMEHRRLLDHSHFFYVEKVGEAHFYFRMPANVPEEIQSECFELFDRLFKK